MPNIISEHLAQEVTEDINILLRDLLKVIKVLSLYPLDNPLPVKMRNSIVSRFVDLVQQYNGFCFDVRAGELVYQNEIVFRDRGRENVLADIFYNAGIIRLEFHNGIEGEEVDSFLDTIRECVTNPTAEHDLVSMLWEKQFSRITFETIEDIALSSVESDVDIHTYRPTYGGSDDECGAMVYNSIILDNAVEEDDIDADTFDDMGGGVFFAGVGETSTREENGTGPFVAQSGALPVQLLTRSGYELAEEEQKEIEDLLAENRRFDPYRTTARILIETLYNWDNPKLFSETISISEKILMELLEQGHFTIAADFVQSIRDLLEDFQAARSPLTERIKEFIYHAGDQTHINSLTTIINRQDKFDASAVETYLEALGWESLNQIISMLGNLVSQRARIMVCDFLARNGKDRITIIGNVIRDRQWFVVRNAVMILGQIGGNAVLPYLEQTRTHCHERVREETLRALYAIRSEEAIDMMSAFIGDSSPSIRSTCLEYLEEIGGRQVFEKLWKLISTDEIQRLPMNEQESILIAYSRLGGEEVVDFFRALIVTVRLLGPSPPLRYRMAAITALAHNSSPVAERLLLKFTESRRRWLRQAAIAALQQHRYHMYGGDETDA